jgi:hypothetical protein
VGGVLKASVESGPRRVNERRTEAGPLYLAVGRSVVNLIGYFCWVGEGRHLITVNTRTDGRREID